MEAGSAGGRALRFRGRGGRGAGGREEARAPTRARSLIWRCQFAATKYLVSASARSSLCSNKLQLKVKSEEQGGGVAPGPRGPINGAEPAGGRNRGPGWGGSLRGGHPVLAALGAWSSGLASTGRAEGAHSVWSLTAPTPRPGLCTWTGSREEAPGR